MSIIQKYEFVAKEKKRINIGIGLGDSQSQNQKILTAGLKFSKKFNSIVSLFGKKDILKSLREKSLKSLINSQIKLIECQVPEKTIIEFLERNSIQAVVRGSLGSNKFIKNLKMNFEIEEISRLALLETLKEQQFFYGPVGIDECNNLENKLQFLELSLKELQKLEIIPKISILSGGRLGDIGRDPNVDQTIQDAEKIIEIMKKKHPNLQISHEEILIENAIDNKSNFIMAPDGISGNLIYRTLVHLGGGKAYGAIYMGDISKTIIDTSRVGDLSEIYGALILALALS